jgi:hypothetical protein
VTTPEPNLFGRVFAEKEIVATRGIGLAVLSAVRTAGVVAMVLALGVSGACAAEAAAQAAPGHAVSAMAKDKHPKKHPPKYRRSMKIDSAVDTATGTTDYVGGTSDQVVVKMTVATSTPLRDAVLIYLTKGGCFKSLSDANQYTTNQFIASDPSSVGDRSVVNWLNHGVPAGSASGTFDAISAVGSGYSTVCATIYNQHVDPITYIVTSTPYFTISAPLTTG